MKLLRGFDKVTLAPSETRTMRFTIPVSSLAYWNTASRAWSVERVDYDVLVGGSSAAGDLVKAAFQVH